LTECCDLPGPSKDVSVTSGATKQQNNVNMLSVHFLGTLTASCPLGSDSTLNHIRAKSRRLRVRKVLSLRLSVTPESLRKSETLRQTPSLVIVFISLTQSREPCPSSTRPTIDDALLRVPQNMRLYARVDQPPGPSPLACVFASCVWNTHHGSFPNGLLKLQFVPWSTICAMVGAC